MDKCLHKNFDWWLFCDVRLTCRKYSWNLLSDFKCEKIERYFAGMKINFLGTCGFPQTKLSWKGNCFFFWSLMNFWWEMFFVWVHDDCVVWFKLRAVDLLWVSYLLWASYPSNWTFYYLFKLLELRSPLILAVFFWKPHCP